MVITLRVLIRLDSILLESLFSSPLSPRIIFTMERERKRTKAINLIIFPRRKNFIIN